MKEFLPLMFATGCGILVGVWSSVSGLGPIEISAAMTGTLLVVFSLGERICD